MNRYTFIAALTFAVLSISAASAEEELDAVILGCAGIEVSPDSFNIVYGPFWDGAWRLTVTQGDDEEPPMLRAETFDYRPAGFVVVKTGTWTRPARATDVRHLRRTALTMVNEIELVEDEPELYSQRRPLTIQVGMSDGTTRCASGYANWPRLPGSYFFEAVDLIQGMVINPGAAGDAWPAVRLLLDQVRSARMRR